MAVRQNIKDYIKKHGPFYAPIAICPLDYHGYKYTQENINEVIEEIEYELSVHPEHADILLDHINNVKAKSPKNNGTTENNAG